MRMLNSVNEWNTAKEGKCVFKSSGYKRITAEDGNVSRLIIIGPRYMASLDRLVIDAESRGALNGLLSQPPRH